MQGSVSKDRSQHKPISNTLWITLISNAVPLRCKETSEMLLLVVSDRFYGRYSHYQCFQLEIDFLSVTHKFVHRVKVIIPSNRVGRI